MRTCVHFLIMVLVTKGQNMYMYVAVLLQTICQRWEYHLVMPIIGLLCVLPGLTYYSY